MKFSEKWLREWVSPPVDTETLGEQLTFMGLEVDEIVSAAPGFKSVIVARIASIIQHPDADRLRVCDVDTGGDELVQVVCGAPNARQGLVVAFAQVGGVLPSGMKLKKAKLRGVVSMGMLCSSSELGLSDESEGIMELPDNAPVGTDLIDYLELDDSIIDIDLTPDRGDCLSIRGIARDLSAKNDLPLQLREINEAKVQIDSSWSVKVEDDNACVRYAGRIVEGVDLKASSPNWMAERLRRAGVRSINPAVDITNYVMLELGQPMHAFDAEKLQGSIQVRLAKTGERLVLLDGRDVALDAETTIIADESGPIGIAGIMGGTSTAVDGNTTTIFFESALFLPELIAGKPRRYSAHSESAHRFERGVDPGGQLEALEYATGLMKTIAGGKSGPVVDWQNDDRMPIRPTIQVRQSRLQRILGISPDASTVTTIFKRLGINCVPTDEGWKVESPSYRYDLAIEEDYLEEVARVIGYDSLPRTYPTHRPTFRAVPETRVSPISIKQRLVSRGYQEVVTYSFVEALQQQSLRPGLIALPLANPISSELGVMRTTLVGGLLTTLIKNAARQTHSMALFETGLRFLANPHGAPLAELDEFIAAHHGNDIQSDKSVYQQNMLAGLVAGRRHAENWNTDADVVDFFSVKADIENLLQQANGASVTFEPIELDLLHPGQRAGIVIHGESVGFVGGLNPTLQKSLDLTQMPIIFELSLEALSVSKVPKAASMSRFPQVRRDLALLVDDSVSYQSIVEVIRAEAPAFLQDIKIFDIYQGEKLPEGKKSMALGLILQDFSRTLQDSEVETVVAKIVATLEAVHGAVLRV
ncbi:MAG: phenylalanyl-tRNA synthetase beta chain [Gammaproteobacteria bacterium]|jgi:phenylalanyl-tRNA synthetase beta chain